MSKSQRKGRPESHLTNRGVGWGGVWLCRKLSQHRTNLKMQPGKHQRAVSVNCVWAELQFCPLFVHLNHQELGQAAHFVPLSC